MNNLMGDKVIVKKEVVKSWVELTKLVNTYDIDNLTPEQELNLAQWYNLDSFSERMGGLLDNLAKDL